MGKYDYLLKQGWKQEDVEKYIEAQEKGMSPQKAFESVRGGADSEAQIKIVHEVSQEPTQTIEVEPKSTFEPQSQMERIFGRKITSADIENVADKMAVKVQKGIKYVSEDLKKRRAETQARDKELDDIKWGEFKKGYAQRVYREASQPRQVVRPIRAVQSARPTRVVRVMKALPLHVMTSDDMGMGDIFNTGSPLIGKFGTTGGLFNTNIGKAPSPNTIIKANLQSPRRVKTALPRRKNPVNDDTAENILGLRGFV